MRQKLTDHKGRMGARAGLELPVSAQGALREGALSTESPGDGSLSDGR